MYILYSVVSYLHTIKQDAPIGNLSCLTSALSFHFNRIFTDANTEDPEAENVIVIDDMSSRWGPDSFSLSGKTEFQKLHILCQTLSVYQLIRRQWYNKQNVDRIWFDHG